MKKDYFFEIHNNLPREGPGRNDYTQKAYEMLPKLNNPNILDIGCGPGIPTIHLAKISKGTVIGIDIHQPYLEDLKKKIIKEYGRFINREFKRIFGQYENHYFLPLLSQT